MRAPKILWMYLLRAWLRALLLSGAFFTGALFLFFLAWSSRAVARFGLAPGALLAALPGLLPHVLAYSLPLAALAAAVVTFGGLAESHEYTAAAAAGISPGRLALPLVLLAALLSLANLWLYDDGTRLAFDYFRARLLASDSSALHRDLRRPAGRSVLIPAGAGSSYHLHLGQRTPDDRLPVQIVYFRDGALALEARAADCQVEFGWQADPRAELVRLVLRDAELSAPDGRVLQAERLPLEFVVDRQLASQLELGWTNSTACLSENLRRRDALAAAVAAIAAGGGAAPPELVRSWRAAATEVHRKRAMAWACLALTLLGVPLGLLARRGSRVLSFALAVLVGCVIYLPLVVACKALAAAGQAPPAAIWLPTLLAAAAGVVLLNRVGRSAA